MYVLGTRGVVTCGCAPSSLKLETLEELGEVLAGDMRTGDVLGDKQGEAISGVGSSGKRKDEEIEEETRISFKLGTN